MQTDPKRLTDSLLDFLEKERRAILAGNLNEMKRIAAEKERLMSRYQSVQPDQKSLENLREKIARNQALLTAALKGIRAVTVKLGALRGGQIQMTTYNKDGQHMVLGANPGRTVQHKA
ncbi:MAG: flagellar biosynthesis protein FlgN [Rhodobacterales bacterium]|nr:MAG: flagellar biosynthesis protein FlgN [Rhodobacterales bacterium]